jgi:hypothetical protein
MMREKKPVSLRVLTDHASGIMSIEDTGMLLMPRHDQRRLVAPGDLMGAQRFPGPGCFWANMLRRRHCLLPGVSLST